MWGLWLLSEVQSGGGNIARRPSNVRYILLKSIVEVHLPLFRLGGDYGSCIPIHSNYLINLEVIPHLKLGTLARLG